MVAIRPMRIPGRWRDGRALDVHTVSSVYVGDDEFGHARFETRRSAMGDLLYRLKYRTDLFDYDERWRLLDGLHEVDGLKVEGRRVLLFDDLFRSGATLNAVTSTLYDQGHAREVYALTLTRSDEGLHRRLPQSDSARLRGEAPPGSHRGEGSAGGDR
jgi:hypothetical protein